MNQTQVSNESSFNRLGTIFVQVAGPALTILAVGSVAFFLAEIAYDRQVSGSLKWIFALYSFAAVLISRISIEHGFQRASVYGLALAFAVFTVTTILFWQNPLMHAFILALIWWMAGRLTWDCTFIDDTRDATGQGMIDLAIDRIHQSQRRSNRSQDDSGQPDSASEETEWEPEGPKGATGDSEEPKASESPWDHFVRIFFRRRQPNTPGLWALYFLLGGLPLFGLGQFLLPMTDVAGHRATVMHFFVYVTSLLCLLMLCSIMGLNRYLSKNQSSLPVAVAKRWIATGVLLAFLIVGFSFLLPRPRAQTSIGGWIERISVPAENRKEGKRGSEGVNRQGESNSRNRGAEMDRGGNQQKGTQGQPQNQKGGKDSKGQAKGGEKSSGGQQNRSTPKSKSGSSQSQSKTKPQKNDGRQKGNAGEADEKSKHKSNQGKAKGEPKSGDQGEKGKGDRKRSQNGLKMPDDPRKRRQSRNADRQRSSAAANSQDQDRQRSSRSNSNQNNRRQKSQSQEPSNASQNLWQAFTKWFRVLLWLIVALVVIWFAFKHRERIGPWIKSFLAELAEFWARLWNRKPKPDAETPVPSTPTGPLPRERSFAEFQNPFASGLALKWTPEQLVEYTFRALEAWARDKSCPRHPEQTALEFARETGNRFDVLKSESGYLATLYSQMAYAEGSISQRAAIKLSDLWQKLTRLYGSPTSSS